jgi:hypothetical protein
MEKSEFISKYKVSIVAFTILTQLLPQMTIFFSDLCLLLSCFLCGKFHKKIILFFLPFFFISILIILFQNHDTKSVLSTFRVFLAINFVLLIQDLSYHQSSKLLKISLTFIIMLTLGFNLFGLLDPEIYKKLISLYHGEYRGVEDLSTVAELVMGYRLSSFFGTPAISGFFHSFLIIFILMILFNKKYLLLTFVLPIIYLSGKLSLSIIIDYLHIVTLLTFFFFACVKKYKLQFFFIALIPFTLTCTTFLLFANETSFFYQEINKISGWRVSLEGNHYPVFLNMGVYEFFFGYNIEDLAKFKKPLGDNSFLTKLFIGGIFYYIAYIYFIVSSYIKIYEIYCKDKLDKFFFILFFSLMSFVEFGLTGYSLSQVSILTLLLFCLFLNMKNKKI